MKKKKYKFNLPIDSIPSGFIMGDIKGVVMNPYNEVLEPGWIIGSGGEVAIITKDWERDSKSSGIMSVPSNEVWFLTADGEYYDPMYVQIEEEYGDTFPNLPTFDREKTQAANTESAHIYKWVFTEDVTRINDDYNGMFIEDYTSEALPINHVFLPVNYWLNVSELEPYLFEYCNDLESFAIPNSVTSIGSAAFEGCSSLTSITIPNSVTSIGEIAFAFCSGLKSMVVESGNTVYDSRGNCNAIIETATNTLIAGCQNTIIPNSVTSIGRSAFSSCSKLTSVTIPDSVTSIGNGAFSNCSALTSVTIGNRVTSIGQSAFRDCTSLTSITIPNSVMSIGEVAFYHCTSLASVVIPESVTSIGELAFGYCTSLASVVIPESVTSIGEWAFGYCSALTSITCEATTPPTLGSYNNLSNVTAVYVPAESVDAYKTAPNWSYYSNKIQAIL